MSNRAKGRRGRRCLPGHRSRAGPRFSRPRQPGRRQLPVDQARRVGGRAGDPGRHRRPGRRRPVIGKAVAKFGRVDTLADNAGVFVAKPFTEYTGDDFEHVLSGNLAGFFHVTQRAIRRMVAQGQGHVVNVTTTLVGQPVKGEPSALASVTAPLVGQDSGRSRLYPRWCQPSTLGYYSRGRVCRPAVAVSFTRWNEMMRHEQPAAV